MSDLKIEIGTKCYSFKFIKGIFEYQCVEIRQSKQDSLYVFECNTCNHDYKCRILLSYYDKKLYFVSMVFDHVEISEDNENQDFWHTGSKYFLSKKDCKYDHSKEFIEKYKEEIKNLQKIISEKEKAINEFKEWVLK